MCWTNVIIAACLLQASLFADAHRRSVRHRRQAVASSYGSNLPAGYNYQPNTNYYNPNQNQNQNQPTNNFYSNSLGASSNVPVGINNPQQQQQQPQPQQQQPQSNLYNPNAQSWSNPVQQGTNLYSPTGTNANLNPTGQGSLNSIPSASAAGSFYSASNGQMQYPLTNTNANNNNDNQLLTNRDLYNQPSQVNPNTNNNNLLQNAYGNTNPWANTNPNTNLYNSNQANTGYNSPNMFQTYSKDAGRMVLSLGLLLICLLMTL